MKKYFLVFAIAVGSSIATAYTILHYNQPQPETTANRNVVPSQLASYISTTGALQDFTLAAKVATPAVVHIKNTMQVKAAQYYRDPFREFFGDDFSFGMPQGPQTQQSSGSGVIITDNGYIVTNNHVVDNAKELQVTLNDNSTVDATVIGADPNTDLAVIKIERTGLPHLPLANSDNVEVGQWVLAVGNPFDLESTVTAGIVSAKGRSIDILKSKGGNPIESFIQTDAAVNPGNSGGALVNLNGELVGINTAIASPTGTYAGYAFAVPTNIVEKVVDDIIKYGIVQRGFLGVNVQSIDDKLMKDKNLTTTQGVYVGGVVSNGGAEKAGIQEGDVITEVNGVKVSTRPQLMEQVAKYRPGNKISISFLRNGKPNNVTVELRNNQNNTELVTKESQTTFLKLGATLRNLNKNDLSDLGIKNGVEVTELNDGILQNSTGLRPGFIIMKVNDTLIEDEQQLENVINKCKGTVYMAGIYPDYPKMVYYRFELE